MHATVFTNSRSTDGAGSGDKAETKRRCCRCHAEEASQTNRRTPWICSGRLHTNPPFEDLLQLSRWNMPLSATAWWFRLSVAAWASAAWAEAPRQLLKLARSLSALSLHLSVTRLLLLLLLRLCHKNCSTVSHCWMTLLQAAPDVNRASFKINCRLFMQIQNDDNRANFTQLVACTKY